MTTTRKNVRTKPPKAGMFKGENDMEELKNTLKVKVGDCEVNLVFRWEYGDWVCRMSNEFMNELQKESED